VRRDAQVAHAGVVGEDHVELGRHLPGLDKHMLQEVLRKKF
jgi:hypothetical protein